MNFIPKIEYTELYTAIPKSITFDSPPQGEYNEEIKGVFKETMSSNGNFQRQFNYNVQGFDLEFKFQTAALMAAFDDFVVNHANRGGVFKLFFSSDEVDYETFRMESVSYKKQRPVLDSTGLDFEYNFKFSVVRTLDYTLPGDEMSIGAGAIGETEFTLQNNQLVSADVTGLYFSATYTMAAVITYIIYRNTTGAGATELGETGQLFAIFKNSSATWEMTRAANGDSQIGLTITSAGQVQYTSSNITGTPDASYIRFRASTIGVD